ncbi:MAG: RNA-binding S4 domain-containing protein [Pseudomonadota bacterium]
MRVDKWLWQARFFKTRSLSAKTVTTGKLRLNGVIVSKPAHAVKPGDMLTFPQGDWIRLIEVSGLGTRRGPAAEAALLYTDHSQPKPKRNKPLQNPKFEGKGRPTGRARRQLSSLTKAPLE